MKEDSPSQIMMICIQSNNIIPLADCCTVNCLHVDSMQNQNKYVEDKRLVSGMAEGACIVIQAHRSMYVHCW